MLGFGPRLNAARKLGDCVDSGAVQRYLIVLVDHRRPPGHVRIETGICAVQTKIRHTMVQVVRKTAAPEPRWVDKCKNSHICKSASFLEQNDAASTECKHYVLPDIEGQTAVDRSVVRNVARLIWIHCPTILGLKSDQCSVVRWCSAFFKGHLCVTLTVHSRFLRRARWVQPGHSGAKR
jgi:hypothetical protein